MVKRAAEWYQRIDSESRLVWQQLYDLFLPKMCACCLAYGESLEGKSDLCPRCHFLLRQSLLNIHRPTLVYSAPEVVSAGVYEHELAGAILAYKNGGRVDLLPYFATALSRVLNALLEGQIPVSPYLYLVPVPSERASKWKRGFEPADLLARRALRVFSRNLSATTSQTWGRCRQLVLPALAKKSYPVVRSKAGSGQKMLGRKARLRRLENSLVLAKPPLGLLGFEYDVEGKTCVLIDDVVTTGASLAVSARTLQKAGARVLGACTLAAVPQRQGTGDF